jgi:hydroxymethylpyrimidine/phosphomethylpyrimidine kinase
MQETLKYSYASVLSIAGSDSGGGAGIQADLKTFSALGCFGTSAITAVTVQNTLGVFDIHSIPPNIVREQIRVVMADIKPAAVKIGMVHTAVLAHSIAAVLKDYASVPVIFDPVMVSTSGHKLIEDDTIEALKSSLFPLASLITPNLDEAELLTGMKINDLEDMKAAAKVLVSNGCNAVLIKGGHLTGPILYDVFLDSGGYQEIFESEAILTYNTHGTGCTLSAAIAAYLTLGNELPEAVFKARLYLRQALENGKNVKTGQGYGPLNHFFNPEKLIQYELD